MITKVKQVKVLGDSSKRKAKDREENQNPKYDLVLIESIWYAEGILGAKTWGTMAALI